MRKRKTKSNIMKFWYLRPLSFIIGAFVGAIIATVVSVIFTELLLNIKYSIIRPKVELGVNKIFIYKKDFQNMPECEIEIICINDNNIQIPIEFKSIMLFRENIQYKFKTGDFLIKPGPRDAIKEKYAFNDIVLEDALKIPQDSSSAKIELVYEYSNFNFIDTLTIVDSNVVKCTYWQKPILQDTSQFKNIGDLYMIEIPKSTPDSLMAKKGIESINIIGFTNEAGIRDLDMKRFIEMLYSDTIYVSFPTSSFKRKYGGYFWGAIINRSQVNEIKAIIDLKAKDYFSNMDEYFNYEILGISIEDDFSEVTEFIHYVFDPALKNEIFAKYQDIMDVYILIMYEDETNISTIENRLRDDGYRVGSEKIDLEYYFKKIMIDIPPDEKRRELASYLNDNLEDINLVFEKKGILVFCPVSISEVKLRKIANDIFDKSGIGENLCLQFDCEPVKSWLNPAPYSIPILVFMNYSEKTSKTALGSIIVN